MVRRVLLFALLVSCLAVSLSAQENPARFTTDGTPPAFQGDEAYTVAEWANIFKTARSRDGKLEAIRALFRHGQRVRTEDIPAEDRKAVVEPMVAFFKTDRAGELQLRGNMINALSEYATADDLPKLSELRDLVDVDHLAVHDYIRTLEAVGGKESVKALEHAAPMGDWMGLGQCIDAMVKIGTPEAQQALERLREKAPPDHQAGIDAGLDKIDRGSRSRGR